MLTSNLKFPEAVNEEINVSYRQIAVAKSSKPDIPHLLYVRKIENYFNLNFVNMKHVIARDLFELLATIVS